MFRSWALLILSFGLTLPVIAQTNPEAVIPEYQPDKLSGTTLTSIGSDSMGGLVRVWVEAYKRHQPDVKVKVTSLGSATAPPALIQGAADFGPMARPMKLNEREEFVSKFGFEPTQIRAALAAIAVYVSRENPMKSISFDQLDAIYSADPRESSGLRPKKWSALGVSGPFAEQSVVVLGRPANSYLHSYFRQRVLLQEQFVPDLMTTTDLSSMFEALSANPSAIAYGDAGEGNEQVKSLAVSKSSGGKGVRPTLGNIVDESYPLSRSLNIYVVREPGRPLELSIKDFLRFVLSKQGQRIVREQGFTPLPTEVLKQELAKID